MSIFKRLYTLRLYISFILVIILSVFRHQSDTLFRLGSHYDHLKIQIWFSSRSCFQSAQKVLLYKFLFLCSLFYCFWIKFMGAKVSERSKKLLQGAPSTCLPWKKAKNELKILNIHQSLLSHKLVYNGRFSNFELPLLVRN